MLARGKREFLVALRSEGQFIGEMSLFATAALRCASVRAKGRVKVLVIPGEHVHDAINTMPEVRPVLRARVLSSWGVVGWRVLGVVFSSVL